MQPMRITKSHTHMHIAPPSILILSGAHRPLLWINNAQIHTETQAAGADGPFIFAARSLCAQQIADLTSSSNLIANTRYKNLTQIKDEYMSANNSLVKKIIW